MRPSQMIAALLAAAAAPAAPALAVELVSNGSFEAPANAADFEFFSPSSNAGGISGWTVVGDQIARLDNDCCGFLAQDGTEYLDLTGSNDGQGRYGGVTQTIATQAGQSYTLSFYGGNYATNGGSTAYLASAGSTQQAFTIAPVTSGHSWVRFLMPFVATGSTTQITILGTAGNSYTGLDQVSVLGTASAVPEPAAWALMIGGFGIAGAALRRCQSSATSAFSR